MTSAYAPAAGEFVSRLAVSADGRRVAVLYGTGSGASYHSTRVRIGSWSGPINTVTTTVASSAVFVFQDSTTLLYGHTDNHVWSAPVTSGSETEVPALTDYYQIRKLGSTWWLWKDNGTTGSFSSTLYSSPDLTTITAYGTKDEGDSTSRYVVTTGPVPTVSSVANRSALTGTMYLNTKTVTSGQRVYGLTFGTYGSGQLSTYGQAVAWNGNFQTLTYSGYLAHSAYTTSKVTTGDESKFVTVAGQTWNGWSGVLTENTYVRWCRSADLFTTGGCAAAVKVIVNPTVTISKAVSGSSTKLSGTVKRIGGTANLYRYSSGSWVKVASTTISAAGAYSFGYRTLSKATYKVATVADARWGSGSKTIAL